jgi:hypothetical protein
MLRPTGQVGWSSVTGAGGFELQISTVAAFVEVRAQGRYLDEIDGNVSGDTIALRAVSPIEAGKEAANTVNVNVLTSILATRVFRLAASGATPSEAIERSELELSGALAPVMELGELSDPARSDLSRDTDSDARALGASLVILMASRAQGNTLQDLTDRLAADFADNGAFDDATLINALVDARARLAAPAALNNLEAWYRLRGLERPLSAARRWRRSSSTGGPSALFRERPPATASY